MVDFMHIEFIPVFNVADIGIVLGVALLALEILLEERRAAREQKQAATARSDRPADSPEKNAFSG